MAIVNNKERLETKSEQLDIRKYLRYYSIKNPQDSLYMAEFTIPNSDLRLDVLTVNLKNWCVNGYEIKSSRSDFNRDEKWSRYLPYLNFFYFATIGSIIKPEELPEDIGLLELHEDIQENKISDIRYYRLKLVKRAKELQPVFAKMTFGELYMTKILLAYFRKTGWRQENRKNKLCSKCVELLEGGIV